MNYVSKTLEHNVKMSAEYERFWASTWLPSPPFYLANVVEGKVDPHYIPLHFFDCE